MRIAMFTNNYRPFIGGVPISIERLAQGLRKLGHTVYIFAPAYPEQRADKHDKYTVNCKLLTYYKTRSFDFALVNIFNKDIESIFSRLSIDIVHVHHPFWMGKLGRDLARKYGLPLVFSYHTRYEKMLHNVPVYGAIDSLLEKLKEDGLALAEEKDKIDVEKEWVDRKVRKFSNRADLVFTPTGLMRDYLRRIGVVKPVRIMPTGINDSYFKADPDRVRAIRAQYSHAKKWLFCTVSRLTKEKNIEFIIRGLAYFKAHFCADFSLMVIGDGPLKAELQELVQELSLADHIFFVNKVPNQIIGDYYRAADVFLFASQAETQGIVILEAMAAKIPVVAIEATGVVDFVKNGANGYLTAADLSEWAESLGRLLSDRPKLEKFKAASYQTALAYRCESIAKTAETTYTELLASKKREVQYKNKLDYAEDMSGFY